MIAPTNLCKKLIFFLLCFLLAATATNHVLAQTKKKAKLPPVSLTGAALANAQYNFTSSGLKNVTLTNPTSLQFGPDGRLYVSEQGGLIKVLTIKKNAPNDYTVTATEVIDLINKIPNHNDDGTLNTTIVTRQVTGILVAGTATQPVLYVSSSDSRIGGDVNLGDTNLDTNSGIVSVLTWNGSAWIKIDLVRGLPRSEENHSPNGMQLDTKSNTLYLSIGGNTNAGSPSNNFAFTCEYVLSAAILSIDLTAINALPTKGSGNTAYKYDLPTVDDPTRGNNPDGTDVNDPFGGNDGLNQARVVPNGPVKIFSPGYRNAYDIVLTKSTGIAGRFYTVDNGANQGWGGYPENEGPGGTVTNNYVVGEPGSTGPGVNEAQVNNLDGVHYIGTLGTYVPGSYYGGHPVPTRGNPVGAGLYTRTGSTGVWRTQKTGSNPLPADWPPVATANPVEGDFQMPGTSASGALLTFSNSTNGLTEYTASNFNNALKGSVLAASFTGEIYKISFTADGTNVTNQKDPTTRLNQDVAFASGFGSQPLDITAQGDNDVFPGTVWAATYGTNAITIFEPSSVNCTGLYNTADDDGDGYTNADEIDNGTNPCSAASMPPDFDHDFISDLNDPDDDNDGINDINDVFARDPKNGLATALPIKYDLFNNYPGTGFFGLGFTGLMLNGTTDYIDLYNDNNLIAGGAVGAFSIVAVSPNDAYSTKNNQENAFQFGMKPGTSPFTIQARMTGPFFNNKVPANYQSQGIYIGTGNQNNYLKIVLNANGGSGGIEVLNENDANVNSPQSTQYSLPGGIPSTSIDLYLSVNPTTGTVQPRYAVNGGTVTSLGAPIVVSGPLLAALQNASAVAVGIISTSFNATPFTATWDYIYVTADAVTNTGTGSWQTIAPTSGLPTAREENSYAQAGNKFYLLGGRSIMPVQEYEPVNKVWMDKAPPPIEIHHFQAVTLDGLIYAAGSFTGAYPHETPVSTIYMYDPVGNKWLTGSTIPQARRRGSAGAVTYKNKIYLVGGILDGHWSGWVNWFDEYDPATNTWKTLPDAPRARDHFHMEVINNKLYVAGGRRSSLSTGQLFSLTIPEVDVYDFNTGQWTTLPAGSNIPTPRAGTSSGILGNELIIIGGEDTLATAHKETEALNTTTNTWRRLADLQQGRHGTQAIVNNNGIYIVAGAGNQGGSNLLNTQEAFYFATPTVPGGAALAQSQLSAVTSLNFGTVTVNTESVKTLTLSNTTGNQAIMVTGIAINGSTAFTYTSPYPLPFVIAPGKSVDLNVKFKPATPDALTGNIVISHTGQGNTINTSLSGQGSAATGGSPAVYRINAGGPQVTNSIGTFAADGFFSPSPGSTYTTTAAIAGTADPAIYQTERYGAGGTMSYALPVSNGTYTVVLHFAEIYWTAAGKRLFDVSLEGTRVLDNYDIFAKVGAFTATTERFTTTVSDGMLNINFSSLASDGGVDAPKVSAIEVLGSSSNQSPTANAGADQTLTLPASSTTLNGSGSDPDGTITAYSWTQVSGPSTAAFSSKTVQNPTVSQLVQGVYVFRLTVTDNGSPAATASDDVTITLNAATGGSPAVYRINAGGPQVTNSIGTFAADGFFSPSPGSTYTTTAAIAGTADPAIYQTERYGAGGTMSYALPVSNGTYTVVLHFAEIYWTAAGKRLFDVSLEGTRVLDNYDIFAKVGAFTATTERFTTTVSDGMLNINFSSLASDGGVDAPKVSAIEVLGSSSNQSPTANAGADQTLTLPASSTTLNGSGSDPDGTITAYSWTQVSGPSTAAFSSKTVQNPTVSQLVQGVYVFRLTVTDNGSPAATASDDVTITLNAATNTQSVTSFTLINADNKQDIQTINNNATLNLATLPTKNLNIRANTNPATVGSVVLKLALNGSQIKTQTETVTPYALFGDNNGVYNAWTPATGSYTLTATPYTASGGTGTAGTALTINFTVTNQAGALMVTNRPGTTPIYDSLVTAYPNPSPDGLFKVQLTKQFTGLITYTLLSQNGKVLANGKRSLLRPGTLLTFDFSQQMQVAGMYYLSLSAANNRSMLKLISIKN